MSDRRRNFLVGLFMIAGLSALGFLMVMFGEAPSWLGGAEYDLKIVVNEIAGIDDGTPVYLNGIKIGRVFSLDFIDKTAPERGVEIIAKIENQFTVPRGARAACVGPALGLGRGRVEIFATGEGMPPIEPGELIKGEMVNALEGIISDTMLGSLETTVIKVGNFAEQLTPVARDLHEILKKTPVAAVDDPAASDRGITANLFTTIQRFDRTLQHIDELLGDPEIRKRLHEAIDNVFMMSNDGREAFADLRDTSANLKMDGSRIADKFEQAVNNADNNFAKIAELTIPVLEDAARTSANLSVISNNLAQGKGTIGLLLTDDRLYEVLVLSIERAKDVFESLRRLADRFEKRGRVGLEVGRVPIPVDKKLSD